MGIGISGADTQDVTDASGAASMGATNSWNPTVWGANPGTPVNQLYQGGYSNDGSGIPKINDPAAYHAAQQASAASTGQAQDVNRYRQLGAAAMAQQAPQANYAQANGYMSDASYNGLGSAQGGLNNAYTDRSQQLGALAMQQQAAMGQAPSQAQLLGQSMIGQSLQAQLAGASSAHGGAMQQAAAMRNASQQAAGTQAAGTQQLSAMRAQEMATARDSFSNGANALQNSDIGYANAGTNYSNSAAQLAQLSTQQQQFNTQQQMQQNTLNNQGQQYYEGMGFNVNQAALNAGMGMSSQLQQGTQFNQNMQLQQQQQANQMISAGIGGGATLAAGIVTKASGGPVPAGQPTLVGEQGPELIVPQGNSTVLQAQHPASMMAAKQNMTFADIARLRQQADEIERGLKSNLAAGPASRRIEAGTPANGYNTELTKGAEMAYAAWLQRNAPRGDTGADYDYRGAFADGLSRNVGAGEHLTDQFKKPNHETFSDESQYAAHGNPGHWTGNRFTPGPRTINAAPVVFDDTPETSQFGPLAQQPAYLMGGRENPYGEPNMSYAQPQTLASMQDPTPITRNDPYAMARLAGGR